MGMHIAIDGKALRGGTERIKDSKTPYILNALDTITELVIAQLTIAEKENEKTAIPRLLELLNIRESIITIDAVGTTQRIMGAIEKGGGNFVLTVKKSNPLTYGELESLFDSLETETGKLKQNPKYQSSLKEHLQA